MERISASATRIAASAAASGGTDTNSYLGVVASALANQEVRQQLHQQLQLIIQAYDLLTTGGVTVVAGSAAAAGGRVFSFGPFRLLPSQRLLLKDDRRVHIGSRAFDILTTLVERAGEVVGKDELIARVWPGVFVDDCNLKTQVSGVRRALGGSCAGSSHIVTVPGRGYSFVAPVSLADGQALDGPDPKPARIYGHVQDNMTQRHDAGGALSLPAPIRALEPCV